MSCRNGVSHPAAGRLEAAQNVQHLKISKALGWAAPVAAMAATYFALEAADRVSPAIAWVLACITLAAVVVRLAIIALK